MLWERELLWKHVAKECAICTPSRGNKKQAARDTTTSAACITDVFVLCFLRLTTCPLTSLYTTGWQSYPLPETYAAAMDPEKDWGVGNPMNEFRNRRSDVTPQFLQQYAKHFRLPKDWNPTDTQERMRRFRSYLWIGNMQHMRCYETALNFWRRLRSNSQ